MFDRTAAIRISLVETLTGNSVSRLCAPASLNTVGESMGETAFVFAGLESGVISAAAGWAETKRQTQVAKGTKEK